MIWIPVAYFSIPTWFIIERRSLFIRSKSEAECVIESDFHTLFWSFYFVFPSFVLESILNEIIYVIV